MPEYLKFIIIVAVAAVAGVVSYIANKHFTTTEKDAMMRCVEIAVAAAEQIFKSKSGAGAEKKAHVVKSLFELGLVKSQSVADLSQEVNDMIEAAVYALK